MDSDDRSIQSADTQNAKTAGATAGSYGQTAGQIGGTVIPTLTQEATNPQGYTPTQANNQLVAGEQGEGGATSGVTGQAGLNAARTRNTGNLSAVLDAAQQHKGQQLSQNALGVQNQSADLAQQKQQTALKSLGGLYGVDVGAQLKSMGLQTEDENAAVTAGNSGWLQNAEGIGSTLGKMGQGAGSVLSGLNA